MCLGNRQPWAAGTGGRRGAFGLMELMTTLSNQSTPRGLSGAEARARLERYGPNSLPEKPRESLWRRFITQFRSPLIYILLFALVIDLGIWLGEGAHGLPFESFAIVFILLL